MKQFLSVLWSLLLIFDPILPLEFSQAADELQDSHAVSTQEAKSLKNPVSQKYSEDFLTSICGPQVLKKVFEKSGVDVSLEDLIARTQTDYGRTSFRGLQEGLNQHGFLAYGIKTNVQSLEAGLKNGINIIAHYGGNFHYVLIEKIDAKWIYGYNPAVDQRMWRIPRSIFERTWSGTALIAWKPSITDIDYAKLNLFHHLKAGSDLKILSQSDMLKIWGSSYCKNKDSKKGKKNDKKKKGKKTIDPVELANGNLSMHTQDLYIPALGPDLSVERTYNVQLTSEIEGWEPELRAGGWSVKEGKYAGSGDRTLSVEELEDVVVEVKMKTIEAGTRFDYETAWLNVRYQGLDDHYYVVIKTNGDVQLARRKGGVITELGYASSTGYDPMDENTVKMSAIGDNIKVWVNNNLEFDVTDTDTLTGTGSVALESYYSHTTFDDVTITDVATTTSQTWTFSEDENDGMFGRGWRMNYETNLIFKENGDIIVRWGDDLRVHYTFDSGTTTWAGADGQDDELEKVGDEYDLTTKDGTVYHFDEEGQLQTIKDRYDNTLTITYTTVDGKERIDEVTESTGRQLIFNYDENGHCDQITDPLSRSLYYTYTEEGLLETAVDMRGNTRTYEYDQHDRMIGYTDRNNNLYQYELYYNDRCVKQTDPEGKVTKFDYLWSVTQIKDDDLNVWNYLFDDDMLDVETDPEGNQTYYDWDDDDSLIASTTDPNDHQTQFTYDARGNMLTRTDPNEDIETWTYESTYNQMTSYTDKMDNTTTITRDGDGNATVITDPEGNTIQMDYNAQGLMTTMTDKRGNTTTFTYDEYGYLRTITDALDNTATYTFDAGGRLTEVEDALGNTMHFNYDENNNVIELEDAEGKITIFDYDDNDNLTEKTDAFGEITHYHYNPYNEVDSIEDPLGRITEYTQDGRLFLIMGKLNLTQVEDAAHSLTNYTYDKIGRLTSVENALTFTTTYTYDQASNLVQVTDANENSTEYAYDPLDRITTTTYADSSYEKNTYDANGNLTEKILRDGKSISYYYNQRNELVQRRVNTYDGIYLNNTTWDVGGTSAWQGDNFDLKVSMQTVDPGSEDWHTSRINFRYQDADNLYYFLIKQSGGIELVRRKAASQTWLVSRGSSYDPSKLLFIRIRMNGNNIKIWIDGHLEINETDSNAVTGNGKIRLEGHSSNDYFDNVQIEDLDTSDIFSWYATIFDNYTYDENGNLIQITRNGSKTWTFEYDELNRLIGTEDSEGREITYIRDERGQIKEMIYPSGLDLTYTYDANGRLLSVSDTGTAYVTYTYDDRGQRSTRTLGNGLDTTYTYDDVGQLEALLTTSGSTTIASYSYTYDDLGNRETQIDLTGTTTIDYDDISQLTNITYSDSSTQEYVYDPVHNRSEFDPGTSTEYTINEVNEVTLSETGSNSVTYSWDDRGNLEEVIDISTTTSYTHNLLNQLIGVEKTGEDAVSFEYDPLGRRISKTVGATTYHYTWAGIQLIEVRDDGGTVLQKFIYGATIDEPVAMINYIGAFYYTHDGLGNITEITNYAGGLLEYYTYDVYGQPTLFDDTSSQISSSFIDNPFFFTGRDYDFETGLYYYRARYYSPSLGRFLETDPLGYMDSMNLFAYVRNNSWNLVDPLGLKCEEKKEREALGSTPETSEAHDISYLLELKNLRDSLGLLGSQYENNPEADDQGIDDSSDDFFWAILTIMTLPYGALRGLFGKNSVDDVARTIENFLGKDAKVITNKSGDKIFLSKDGTKRIRFDINNTSPHNAPHGHAEMFKNGQWKKSGPIYPKE